MSILSDIEAFLNGPNEKAILALVTDIKNSLPTVASDIQSIFKWAGSHETAVSADIASFMNVAQFAGIAADPKVAASITAANAALAAISTLLTASKFGGASAPQGLQIYAAVKAAQAAAATLAATIATTYKP